MFRDCPIKDEYKPNFDINEAFDFGAANKKKKSINAYDMLLPDILKKLDKREALT
jgi:hypothetical protein